MSKREFPKVGTVFKCYAAEIEMPDVFRVIDHPEFGLVRQYDMDDVYMEIFVDALNIDEQMERYDFGAHDHWCLWFFTLFQDQEIEQFVDLDGRRYDLLDDVHFMAFLDSMPEIIEVEVTEDEYADDEKLLELYMTQGCGKAWYDRMLARIAQSKEEYINYANVRALSY